MEQKQINGIIYGVEKLPATKGLSLQIKLARFLGGGASGLRNVDMGSTESIIEAVGNLATTVNEDDFLKFVKECVSHAKIMTEVEGQDDMIPRAFNFDKHFEDDYLSMWEVFAFMLEVNLSKLLGDIKLRFSNPTTKAKAKKKS